jgi:DNA-binding XRE family transcriptional regulator
LALGKVEERSKNWISTLKWEMKNQAAENYLKTHRKKAGLTQREVARLVGYKTPGQILRHEQAKSVPPLTTAFAYEAVFGVPISTIFATMHQNIRQETEVRLQELGAALGSRSARDRDAKLVAQKLVWLNDRKRRK